MAYNLPLTSLYSTSPETIFFFYKMFWFYRYLPIETCDKYAHTHTQLWQLICICCIRGSCYEVQMHATELKKQST